MESLGHRTDKDVENLTRGRTHALRADAARNRASILKVASRMFDEHGFDVPMSRIADAAGVGRTTLLRNFPTRMELASALFEQVMVDLRALVAEQKGQPGDFEELLDFKLDFYIRHGGMTEAFHKASAYRQDFAAERKEVADLFMNAARSGMEGGILRPDLTVETFMVLQQAMSGALLTGTSTAERREAARILKAILLHGVRQRDTIG